ncbi:MAG: squalene--hopene cyclase [Legionellales bacterium RIFCSPHIGHO2_12_FULL_42_9]|nr:MAG: squalene--hopene cyclase [Legionellales bacterium RIFCSPHIGHO2_12_FULL_42_9]
MTITDVALNSLIRARTTLLDDQHQDGHWCYELEADCTIPAEYIILMHYLDEIDLDLEAKIAVYLRERQNIEGGWPLFYGGKADISCSIKVYYALKMAGDQLVALHMQRARNWILQQGGAAKANVFTRITLALFNQLPWRGVPFMPIEIMLLPRWFPFHINKIAYWSRTVMIPLLVLCCLKIPAKNPRDIEIKELFLVPATKEKQYYVISSPLNRFFRILDIIGRTLEPLIPNYIRSKSLLKAERWLIERLNGDDGLGAIFPAMVNAYKMLRIRGYQPDNIYCIQARTALKNLLVIKSTYAYCQPCRSPIWDTGLSVMALLAHNQDSNKPYYIKALDWIKNKQILSGPADWRHYNPHLSPGGWAFEYNNAYYPDLDDTALIGWAMQIADPMYYKTTILHAADWLAGMQSDNGGFASFDKNNTYYYLNEIPFADHGALLDPPTVDVSARCLTFFAKLDRACDQDLIQKCIKFIFMEQEQDGSWFGRWGTNYIYGTWSVLVALKAAGISKTHPAVCKAVAWIMQQQHADGGFGENNASYFANCKNLSQPSTSYQTAWALLALMAAGEIDSPAVAEGIKYLLQTQQVDGMWYEPWFTAPGFPRVFYLKYHGYSKYFPLWALAQYYAEQGLCQE